MHDRSIKQYMVFSCIHLVVVTVFLLVFRWRWRWFLFLDEIFSIQWAGRMKLEPRLYTFEIEDVSFVARQADD